MRIQYAAIVSRSATDHERAVRFPLEPREVAEFNIFQAFKMLVDNFCEIGSRSKLGNQTDSKYRNIKIRNFSHMLDRLLLAAYAFHFMHGYIYIVM